MSSHWGGGKREGGRGRGREGPWDLRDISNRTSSKDLLV